MCYSKNLGCDYDGEHFDNKRDLLSRARRLRSYR